jgi:hypothetical protein
MRAHRSFFLLLFLLLLLTTTPTTSTQNRHFQIKSPVLLLLTIAQYTLPCATASSGLSDNVIIDTDDYHYVGQVLTGSKTAHGRGVCAWKGKDIGNNYNGEWKDGKRTGQGVLTYPGGRRYEGEFKDDKKAGKGVFTWPDGERYEGEFNDDHRSGNGVHWLSGGRVFDGVWAEGFPQHGTAMEPGGALFRAKFDGKSLLGAVSWAKAQRVPAGRVASGGPPPHGGSGGQKIWRGRAELLGGVVVDGVFRGLRPHGSAVLAEGGARYLAEYDGARTIAEEPVPVRKQVRRPAHRRIPSGSTQPRRARSI